MSGGKINATELVASLICKKASLVEGIQYAQKIVDGSLTLLLMTKGRTLRGERPLWKDPACDRKERGCLLCLL